jgi:predicted amidohydrolase
MKVTLLQTDIRWARPDENIRQAARMMAGATPADLYVLPEMWSTGFATEPENIAEDEARSEALAWMQQEARERRCAISGSLAVRITDGTYRNRHYFADGRTGTLSIYDKHHLFSYGGENRFYTPGQKHTVVSYCGWRLLLLTCYDLRFPCWDRYADDREYDAIVIVANWPESRQNVWHLLTRARAIENQCCLIGCNRVGEDRYSHYTGASCVIDAFGNTLGQCRRNREDTLTVELDLEKLNHGRRRFCVLDDRDKSY